MYITIMSQPTTNPVLREWESSHKTRQWQEINAVKYHKGGILTLLYGAWCLYQVKQATVLRNLIDYRKVTISFCSAGFGDIVDSDLDVWLANA